MDSDWFGPETDSGITQFPVRKLHVLHVDIFNTVRLCERTIECTVYTVIYSSFPN